MFAYLLKLNIKRIFRTLKVIGIIRGIILSLFVFFGYYIAVSLIFDGQKTVLISIALVFVILSIHVNRKDKLFLQNVNKKSYFIFISQYLIIILPFLAAYIICKQYIIFCILILAIFLISLIKKNIEFKNNFKYFNYSILSPLNFEWFSGLRQNWFLVLIIYLLSFFLAKYELGIIIPIAANALFITSFYMESEPVIFLNGFRLSPRKYIIKKIFKATSLFNILYLPVYLLYMIMYYEHFYLLIFAIVSVNILLLFTILTKYSTYEPNQMLKGNFILIILFCLCFTKPFLFPIPLILIIRNYYKSIDNLKNYMYVTD